ncbi:MAG: hypothetical protein Q8N44_09980 [Rubrivivax sp.]|nr:hypothetical protein [Rubrivivax sp.]
MNADVYPVSALSDGSLPPLSDYGRRLLAEGDSWFTLGTLKLAKASNLLIEQQFGPSTAIVSCAYPGDTLQHVVDGINDVDFDRVLREPNFARWWEAILVSAGGNDLIDAAGQRAVNADGSPAPLAARLLLTQAEAATVNAGVSGPLRYISEAGWTELANYLRLNFGQLVERRDQGPSAGRPIVVHTYSVPVVRPSGTVGASEGWLFPAFRDYGIPAADSQAVAEELFERLRLLLLGLDSASGQIHALPHFHTFDSARLVNLTPASPQSTGNSGDWINEIHPSRNGYRKIGKVMGAWIDTLLTTYP